jgi:hypothetical protein
MSGPIVRKYGFPNFEQIFGERELQHGSDESESAEGAEPKATDTKKKASTAKPGSAPKTGGKKKG